MSPTPNPTTPIDEHRWIKAILRDGDEQAFRELYRRHAPRLLSFALRLLGEAAEAEDAAQEAWTRAVVRLGDFRRRSSFSTWLLGIARHLCLDRLRQRGRWMEEAFADGEERHLEGWPWTAKADADGPRLDLERAVALLPAGCRAVLVLHDVEGFTHQEIARELEIAPGTSKSQLFEARRRVREHLRQPGERS